MAENIDEDKKILEELTEDTIRYGMVETDAYMAGAITRVLEELETYKKIAEKLADEVKGQAKYQKYCMTDNCTYEKTNCDITCIIDWARKEVEKDGK